MITVIYHRADYDGLFSAAVCKKFLPIDTQFIGWDFGDPLIKQPDGTTYIVDLSPDCLESVQSTSNLIWIDHHKSSIEKWDKLDGNHRINGYRIDGVAACRLCWQWFWKESGWIANLPTFEDFKERRVDEPLALTLAGEYDVWDLRDERAVPFQYGLTAGGYCLEDGLISMLDEPKDLSITGGWVFRGDVEAVQIARDGVAAFNWQQAFATTVMNERSYVREWEGLSFTVLASSHARSSQWFPADSIPDGSNALMCWRYDGKSVKFSLYHAPGHEEHDLSPIATKYGGGGHRGACGFELPLDDALEIIR